MGMNQLPTLLIGIGGIGCQMAAVVDAMLTTEDRNHVAVVGIDTDAGDIAHLPDSTTMKIIRTSDNTKVDKYLERNPECAEWFPDDDFLRARSMKNGAGQVRALSRLAFLDAVKKNRFAVIKQEVTRIRKIPNARAPRGLTVIIVGSITGGTGAGLFLNLPFYLRHFLRKEIGITDCVIRGMFFGPDITEGVQVSPINRSAVRVNGYACLKELNAYWQAMAPSASGTTKHNNLRLDFYDCNNQDVENNIPYNYLYLLEKNANDVSVGEALLPELIDYAGHMVHTLMFTPVADRSRSVEDNFTLGRIAAGGTNRISGLGMCRLIYDQQSAEEYVAKLLVYNLVQEDWLLIDREYREMKKNAVDRRRTDRTAKMPAIETSYVESFEKHTIKGKADMAHLAEEAYEDAEATDPISKAKNFIAQADHMVSKFMSSSDVKKHESKCEIDTQEMKSYSTAIPHSKVIWKAMQDYFNFAESSLEQKPNQFVNEMIPTTVVLLDSSREEENSIFNWLAGVHPVVARYLIYDMIRRLDEEIKKHKTGVSREDLESFKNADFDLKKEGKQKPHEKIGDLQEGDNPLWKAIGLGSHEARKLAPVKRKLRKLAQKHVTNTHQYLERNLKLSLYELLKERLVILAKMYQSFFALLEENIERNKQEIFDIANTKTVFGQIRVYGDADALADMAEQFRVENAIEMTKETKTNVFMSLYKCFEKEFKRSKSRRGSSDEYGFAKEKDISKRLDDIFSDSLVKTVEEEVVRSGRGIIDLNIKEALIKEFELKTNLDRSDNEYNTKLTEYIHARVADGMSDATPVLGVEEFDETSELFFFALSDKCASRGNSAQAIKTNTMRYYLPSEFNSSQVMIDSEFSEKELICLRAVYNYEVFNLTQYQDNTENEQAYTKRISNLGRRRFDNTIPEDATINPHLNCFWHEEAYTSPFLPADRLRSKADTIKAFVYALGFDFLQVQPDDENEDADGNFRLTWFSFMSMDTSMRRIVKNRELIGNSYFSLYESLYYNGKLKKMILSQSEDETKTIKGFKSAESLMSGILKNDFVADLICDKKTALSYSDQNIFDTFFEMYGEMQDQEAEWEALFYGLLITLWEFCGTLFPQNTTNINKATRQILEAAYSASDVKARVEAKGRDALVGEKKVANLYARLREIDCRTGEQAVIEKHIPLD